MGGVHSVPYGGHLFVVDLCGVTIWRHIHVSKPTFWRSLLTLYAYFSTRTRLILCVIALNINYQRSRLGYRRKINPMLRHRSSYNCKILTACWRRVKHSSLRQSVLQLQNEVALMSRRIWAVEHRCVAELAGAHPVCKIESCWTTQQGCQPVFTKKAIPCPKKVR